MVKLRVLGVGAGYFSQFQVAGWRNIPEVECVGIVNRDTAKAQALAARFGIARFFGDLDIALDETRPDLVDLITPPPTHRAFIARIVAHGIPVICQKPFGQSYAEAVAITEVAERAGVPLIIHENYRWDPAWREAKRLVAAGRSATCTASRSGCAPATGRARAPISTGSPVSRACRASW